MVTKHDIVSCLKDLGLAGASAEVHSSLAAFGPVAGGARTVVDALTSTLSNILVPAFIWDASVPPPDGDRPANNATPDPSEYSGSPVPFDPASSAIGPDMGIVSQTVAKLGGAVRSAHPLTSWVAWGRDAAFIAGNHPWDSPQFPVARLLDLDGYALMLGTTLNTLTAVHMAEEKAGRRPFIRWVIDAEGKVRRVRIGGCSGGFDRMALKVSHLIRKSQVGTCSVLAVPLRPLLNRIADLIRVDPEITMCSDRCERCRATVAGGPV